MEKPCLRAQFSQVLLGLDFKSLLLCLGGLDDEEEAVISPPSPKRPSLDDRIQMELGLSLIHI